MAAKQKLGNPFFVTAVLVLMINDWYCKPNFHNVLTGKLSDFAGLFAFAYFLGALWPRRVLLVHTATLVLFMVWKSPLAQPFIDSLNGAGVPIDRVVDYSDYVALLVLPLSYYLFNASGSYCLKPVLRNLVICFSVLSFVATSMVRGKYTKITGINKTYSFNFSKRELVSRVNSLQLEYIKDLDKYVRSHNSSKSLKISPDTANIDFDSKTNTFYFSSNFNKKDTIAQLLDYKRLQDADTIRLRTMHSDINISGDGKHSELKLLGLMRYVELRDKSDAQEKAVGLFEKWVIKKIDKGYGK
ncbi:hypothetical protein [Mucilaginibacter psychrotolerans]|uniref:Uncharacterized protein n=1 Tax=Mucilaginibacter psychrotolerans TaxID=1524096 RepID=A0A4Y8SPV6_9SPHI|nr:hypothetical protein [Mucilaginibacter psychrotolerans]TFF40938.1 hypothetical protein E2R66_01825 [Mucilaginibacter psychrotolerans]